jgi:hypothetical protein
MKKPTLRLRQVFEGPTHFKVVKPLGNPIKIAKKGLSPNLMGRLRKFARQGEVPEVAEGESRALDMESDIEVPQAPLPSAPTLAEIMARPEFVTVNEPVGTPVEVIKASDVAQTPIETLPVTTPERVMVGPVATPAPRQRVLTPAEMMGPPAPVVVAAPEPMAAATRTRPRRPGAVAPVEAVEAAPAAEETTAPAPVQRGQVAGRPRPQRGAIEATAEVEPAEAAAPAEKPAPVEPSPFEKALGSLGYTMAQYKAMPAPMKVAAQQAVRATIAAQTAADAEAKALEQENVAYAEQEKALKKEADSLTASAKAARETQQKILDEYDYLKNPTSYFASLNPLQQIGTAISLAMGAFASGMTGMPNFAQKIYDNAIEQDLQAQKRKSDSLYQRLVQAGNSVNSAEDLVRAQLKLIGAAEMSRRSAQIKLPQVKAQIEAKAASEALKATSEMQRIAKDQATMAREAELGPLRVQKLRAETKIAEGTPARLEEEMRLRREKADRERKEAELAREDRIAATEDKAEQERIARGLTVGTTELELKSKTGSKDVRDNIAAREQAMMSILKLESLFKKEGYSVFNPLSEARTEAIEELATFIEQYPKAAGFKRAISLSAAKQLKEGLQAPAGGIAFVKKVLGVDPTVAITGIRKEVQRSYADQVRSVVRNPQSDAVNDAILSAYAKADEEIKKYEMMQTPAEELFSEE